MKKLLIIALVLLTTGVTMAQNEQIRTNKQVNTLIVNSSGDITLRQDVSNETNDIIKTDSDCYLEDSVLVINGHADYTVTMAALTHLIVNSSGDVNTSGTMAGNDLDVVFNSSGDTRLDLDYDNVYVYMNSSGDLVLRGKCNDLFVENNGSGDVITKRMEVSSQHVTTGGNHSFPNLAGLSGLLAQLGANLGRLTESADWEGFARDMEQWGEDMEAWGRDMEEWGDQIGRQMEGRGDRQGRKNHDRRPEQWGQGAPDLVPQPDVRPDDIAGTRPQPWPGDRTMHKNLLLDPHWGGIDLGVNMLLDLNPDENYALMDLRPLKSWGFNFNIADVGIAFNHRHTAGLYTGIGLGWNNYRFENPIRLIKGDEHLEAEWIDEGVEGRVKKSKLGVLYVQAPLMLEVRPTRSFFLAAGVTGGVRVDSWTKVKFRDDYKEKVRGDYYLNPLKLDATLRAGGDDMGFFATYDLLPTFVEGKGPGAHTFHVGFSMIF